MKAPVPAPAGPGENLLTVSNRAWRLLAAALLIGVAMVYWPVRNHEFLLLDDGTYVSGNPMVQRGVSIEGFRWALTSTAKANWHPLTWFSHMLDVTLFGMNPGRHHLSSLLLHLAATLALFRFLRTATGAPGKSLFVAALFALHPLHVESVAWIAERKDVLAGLLWFLALGAYVRYARRPGAGRAAPLVGLYALGLCAKPMVVTFPVVLLVLDFWPLGRFFGRGRPFRSLVGLAVEKAPLFLLAGAASVLAFLAQQGAGALVPLGELPPGARIANALVSLTRYLGKTLWPAALTYFYPYQVRALADWQVLGAAALLSGVTVLCLVTLRRSPFLLAGWSWFLVMLLPVAGLIQVGIQGLADRYTYLPLVGLFIAAVWGAQIPTGRRPGVRRAVLATGVAVLVLFAVVARRQLGHWHDSRTLAEHGARLNPGDFVLRRKLAHVAYLAGDLDGAERHFAAAARLEPLDATLLLNWGTVLVRLGRTEEGILRLEEALRLRPGYQLARRNLDRAIELRGQGSTPGGRAATATGHGPVVDLAPSP